MGIQAPTSLTGGRVVWPKGGNDKPLNNVHHARLFLHFGVPRFSGLSGFFDASIVLTVSIASFACCLVLSSNAFSLGCSDDGPDNPGGTLGGVDARPAIRARGMAWMGGLMVVFGWCDHRRWSEGASCTINAATRTGRLGGDGLTCFRGTSKPRRVARPLQSIRACEPRVIGRPARHPTPPVWRPDVAASSSQVYTVSLPPPASAGSWRCLCCESTPGRSSGRCAAGSRVMSASGDSSPIKRTHAGVNARSTICRATARGGTLL